MQRMLLRLAALAIAFVVPLASVAKDREVAIGLQAAITSFDPHYHNLSPNNAMMLHVFESLIAREPGGKLVPSLATSWKAVDDSTWRFELRPNVAFPNGEKLDAAAVKWNFERVLDPKVNARIKSWFTAVKDVNVISPTEVEIVTSAPFPALPKTRPSISQRSMARRSPKQFPIRTTRLPSSPAP